MNIADNLKRVRYRIETAAKRAGRNADEIRLVAVSKKKSAEEIRAAFDAGQRTFGENYAQEFKSKAEELRGLDIKWHFIGHLQSNKAKLVTPYASMIETIDSAKIAKAVSARSDKTMPCLLEVSIANEESKFGVNVDDIFKLISYISELDNIKLEGLMCMPPFFDNPEESRPYFSKLKQLLTLINQHSVYSRKLTQLSMGMSNDFEVAIEEGATIVRVGTAIFGQR